MIGRVSATGLLALCLFASAVEAGQLVVRETETGIYVELTGEKGPDPALIEQAEKSAQQAAAAAREAADEKRRMEKYAQQKAKLQARRMNMQEEE